MKINYFPIVDKYVPTADTQNRMCWVKWPLVYQMKLIVFHMKITREPDHFYFIASHCASASSSLPSLSSSSWNLIKIKNSFQFLSPSEWADWSEWHAYDGTFIAYTIAHWLICYWTNIIKSTSQLIETDSKSIDLSFVLEVMKRIFFCVHRSFHQSLVHWLDEIVNPGWFKCNQLHFRLWTTKPPVHQSIIRYLTNLNTTNYYASHTFLS